MTHVPAGESGLSGRDPNRSTDHHYASPVPDTPPTVSGGLRWWLTLVHAVAAWTCHRSPVRIGSRLDRRLHRLIARVTGRTNPSWHPTATHGIVRRLARFAVPKLSGPVFAPTRLGFDLCIDETCGNQYWHLGEYEAGTLDLIRRVLGGGGVFLDIGASVGQMSLFAAHLSRDVRVVAFEPESTRHRYLVLGAERAGLANITIHRIALGEANGQAQLRTDLVSPSMIGADETEGSQSVEVRRLDDVLESESVSEVAMIKLDVEGAELGVLRGAEQLLRSPGAPVVCFEQGVLGSDAGVADFLRSCNEYRFYRFRVGQNTDGPLVALADIGDAYPGENVIACTPAHAGLLPETVAIQR